MEWPDINYKYLIILIVTFIVIYYVYKRYYLGDEGMIDDDSDDNYPSASDDDEPSLKSRRKKAKRAAKKAKRTSAKSGRSISRSGRKERMADTPADDPDQSAVQKALDVNDMDIGDAAEQLYDAIHLGLCDNNLSPDDFKEATSDEWGNNPGLYIALKQLYNECKDSGNDPQNTITADNYAQILDSLN